ncbi:hypothetical protein IMG5_134320, partial [Ichthyophthirius multifiliis]
YINKKIKMQKSLLIIVSLSLLLAVITAEQKLVTKEFGADKFSQSDVQGWTVQGQKNLVSECAGQSVFGGYDAFGQGAVASKVYSSGVPHYELEISFELFAIDSWDDEVFTLKLDDKVVYTYSTQYNKVPPQGDRKISCGSTSWSDKFVVVKMNIQHNSQQFKLEMSSTLNQDANDESWGIRNLIIVANFVGYNSYTISREFTSDNFQENAQGWVLSQPLINPFTTCGADKIFGGYNAFGEKFVISKTFSYIPEHYGLVVDVTLWFIDSPDANDYLYVTVDGQRYRFNRGQFNFVENKKCGTEQWGESTQRVNLFFPHTSSQATVQFTDDFDEKKDNESWGIQNFVLTALTGNRDNQTLVVNELFENDFKQASGWKLYPNGQDVSTRISNCAGANLLGGYNQLSREDIFKIFTGLPGHTNVRIFFRLFAVDSWDNENFRVYVNDVLVQPKIAPFQQSNKVCGVNGWDDSIRNYLVDVPHLGSTLNLRFESDLDQSADDESYGIRDLKIWTYYGRITGIVTQELNDDSNFLVQGWNVTPALSTVTSKCGPYALLGGYNVFGQNTVASKTYSVLTKHNTIKISFKLFFIDTWDKEDFIVWVDDQVVGKVTKSETWGGQQNICGWDASKEEIYDLQFTVYHTGNSVKVSFGDKLDQGKTDESWGIRDLVITTSQSGDKSYENQEKCVVIFSEQNFKGNKLTVCESDPNITNWNQPIQSIWIPQQNSLVQSKVQKFKKSSKKQVQQVIQ